MMKRIIIIVLSFAIIFGFLFWKFGPNISSLFNKSQPQGPVVLTYWGLWEDDSLVKPLLAEYTKLNPNVTVNYVRQSSVNYRTRVQTQIREGVGPDVFMIHNSWFPMFTGDLAPAPEAVLSLSDFRNMFYPVTEQSFVSGSSIYAAPSEIDGLALFYNEDILNGISGKVPRTWQEFMDTSSIMTVKDVDGQIRTAGAALGATGNVDHWSDILGLLLLQQPGIDLKNLSTPEAAEVLTFYTGFITDPKRKSWDINLPNSTTAFAQGRVGFYFAPSWRAHDLRLMNPNLKFKIAPVPQLSNRPVAWASFWALAVSSKGKNTTEAWKFIKYMTSTQAEEQAYQLASQVRLFGQPYSQISLGLELAQDPIVGAFVTQGQIYKFWYLASNTQDVGINDEMIKYFEDGVNSVLAGQTANSALQTVNQGVAQVLSKYTRQAPAQTGR